MAKVKTNPVIDGLSGSIGRGLYARQMRDGRTILSAKPDFSDRQFSGEQLDQQSHMKQGAAYAKAARINPIYAKAAAGTSKNAFNIALRDWFKPPVIQRIEFHQGCIRVLATDDVMVTGVTVTVLDAAGQRLEQGVAELTLGACWEYRAAHQGPILVEARDMAGNVTRQEFSPASNFSVWETTRQAGQFRA